MNSEYACIECGTPLVNIGEPCPNCMPSIAWRAPTRKRYKKLVCQLCGGPYPIDISIPSSQWNAVIRESGLPDFLCFSCIIIAFAKAGKSFTATLWGDGFQGLSVTILVNKQPIDNILGECNVEQN